MENQTSKSFIEVLLKTQKEMPVVERTARGYNYKYAPLDEVWDKVKDVLQSNGFVVTNEVSEEGVLSIARHELGELRSFIRFSNIDLKPQDRGSEITYYRRYNLTSMFNIIVVGEDDDATVTTTAKPVSKNLASSYSNNSAKVCSVCSKSLPTAVYEFSNSKFGKPLCRDHQK